MTPSTFFIFQGLKSTPDFKESDIFGVEHKQGQGILHLGEHFHEALPISREGLTRLKYILLLDKGKEHNDMHIF